MNYRQLFFRHISQTSPNPIGLEMDRAEGIYLYSKDGRKYIDGISGFSVANIGHSNPKVIQAVKEQAEKYMHLIVYGEFIEDPQVAYAKYLIDHLPQGLDCVYFANSGTEAVEGAMKLAKKVTGRSRILCCKNAYHGSSQGALSLMGGEYWVQPFRPLLPDTWHLDFNSREAIKAIDDKTACIILETVQGEGGVIKPSKEWMEELRKKCTKTGTLLILDEIQAGFGRTGSLWAFEQYGIVPDVLMLAKALGGGMPLGAFISSYERMYHLTEDPILGHINTFGGHPVSCAAGLQAMKVLLESKIIENVPAREQQLRDLFKDESAILDIRSAGLLMALNFESETYCRKVIERCISNGLIADSFLFHADSMRIAPPLITTEEQIKEIAAIVRKSLSEVKASR